MNPFELLGIQPGATEQAIRAAYRIQVKKCHPDQFQEVEQQKIAEEKLIQLNLAYEEALRLSAHPNVGYHLIPSEEAKHFARRLLEQGKFEAALRQLTRAECKDAEWYYLQGEILMLLKQYETAHQSYRKAVRMDPENKQYHSRALDAAIAIKKSRPITEKIVSWAKKAVGR